MSAPMPMFDADNHYYEARDAFTRHLPREFANRGPVWVTLENGHQRQMIRGKVDWQVPNPTYDPISKPGVLRQYYRGNPDDKSFAELMRSNLEPLPAAYQDSDARLALMDEQGVDAAWLFPTTAVHYEEVLKNDLEANVAVHRAFNRWLQDDWGYANGNRIFAAPYITLADPDEACAELDHVLDQGARVVVMRPAAVVTRDGSRSPGDELFDGFWQRVSDAGIVVVAHVANSGYKPIGYPSSGGAEAALGGGRKPTNAVWTMERAICDWLAALVFDRVFERFPGVRVASVENGAVYLHDLFRQFDAVKQKYKHWFTDDPADTFREHVWINPFWEDKIDDVIEHMGVERVLFGSDFPHMEGLEFPAQIFDEIGHLPESDQRRLVYDNAAELTGARVPSSV